MQALMVNQIKTGNRETAGAGFLMSAALGFLLLACSESDSLKKPTYPIEVLEGYTVEMVAGPDLLDFPMFATLDETGRLFVFESIGHVYEKSQDAIDNPQFRIKLLQDLDGDGRYEKSTIFADRLSFPQGGVFYKGSLYASAAPDLLKLTDTDGDGVADEREVLLSGWILNVNANSLIGPFLGPDGWLYMTSAIMGFDVTSKEGERLKGETARIWRVKPDGSDLNWVAAGGMNNPVELTFTNAGEVIGTQTFFVYPQRGLRDALTFWVEGGAYGKKLSRHNPRQSHPDRGSDACGFTIFTGGSFRNRGLSQQYSGGGFPKQPVQCSIQHPPGDTSPTASGGCFVPNRG